MYDVGSQYHYQEVFVVLRSLRRFHRRRRRGRRDVRQQSELSRDHAREAVILVVLLVRICAVMGWLNRKLTQNTNFFTPTFLCDGHSSHGASPRRTSCAAQMSFRPPVCQWQTQ